MPHPITIMEVGPRDGLQNEKTVIPTAIKQQFIQALIDSGLANIEISSFVSPQWVPQLQDHETILSELVPPAHTHAYILTPNEQGLARALSLGATHVALITAASDTFNQKNTRRSREQSLATLKRMQQQLQRHPIPTTARVYISCVFDCPYEGIIPINQVIETVLAVKKMGFQHIALGDTTGQGTPESTHSLLKALSPHLPIDELAVHFHDTEHRAIANIDVALSFGITTIDSAAGGLGGCPYSPGATGNVATEHVVDHLHDQGYTTGVNSHKIRQAASIITTFLNNHTTNGTA